MIVTENQILNDLAKVKIDQTDFRSPPKQIELSTSVIKNLSIIEPNAVFNQHAMIQKKLRKFMSISQGQFFASKPPLSLVDILSTSIMRERTKLVQSCPKL